MGRALSRLLQEIEAGPEKAPGEGDDLLEDCEPVCLYDRGETQGRGEKTGGQVNPLGNTRSLSSFGKGGAEGTLDFAVQTVAAPGAPDDPECLVKFFVSHKNSIAFLAFWGCLARYVDELLVRAQLMTRRPAICHSRLSGKSKKGPG